MPLPALPLIALASAAVALLAHRADSRRLWAAAMAAVAGPEWRPM